MRESPKSWGLGESYPYLFGNWFPSPWSRGQRITATLSHTEHHLEMADVVFKSRKSEAIADLLHAWVTGGSYETPTPTLLSLSTEHLVGLHDLVLLSLRLRRLVIRSVESIGYGGFEGLEVQRYVELLNHLRVTVEDMNWKPVWTSPLLDTLQSSEVAQCLSYWYWELLVELVISESPLRGRKIPYPSSPKPKNGVS